MVVPTAKRLDGIGEYYFSTKLQQIAAMNAAGEAVINLGIGSPDLPPHPDVIRVLQEEAARHGVHAYQSYRGAPELRVAASDWYRRSYGVELDPAAEILPLIGSKEGILHLCMTYLNEGNAALVPNPGYPTYRSAVQLAGGTLQEYDLIPSRGWQPDLDALETAMSEASVRLLFLNSPHMPTGSVLPGPVLQSIVSLAKRHGVLIVHDNPYSFILNERPASLLAVPGATDCVVELNSLSKSHNLAGWRVGFLCGDRQHIDNVIRFKSNMDSGMFLPLQRAAARALQLGEDWFGELNAEYARRRTVAKEILALLGCRSEEDQSGLFLWADVGQRFADGYDLSDRVLENARVFLTPGGIFGSQGNRFVRISLCSPEAALKQAAERIKSSGL